MYVGEHSELLGANDIAISTRPTTAAGQRSGQYRLLSEGVPLRQS